MRSPLARLPFFKLPIQFREDLLEGAALAGGQRAEQVAGDLRDVGLERDMRARSAGADPIGLAPPILGVFCRLHQTHMVQRCQRAADVHGVHAHEFGQVVAGGFALAGYCFYFFRESSDALPVVTNRRIGVSYLAGTTIVLVLAITLLPWSALLMWPAISLGLVATAYFGLGPIIFRKANGRLPWSTQFVLGPCLLGQYLSLLYYRRQCRSWDPIMDRVWIGGKLPEGRAREALRSGVTAVLDLSPEFSETTAFRETAYRNIPILDLTAPTSRQLEAMSEFIEEQSRRGVVYVHCKIGYSRSAAAVAAYLIKSGQAGGAGEAFAIIRRKRPSIVIRPEIVSALAEFEQEHRRDPDSFLLVSAQTVTS